MHNLIPHIYNLRLRWMTSLRHSRFFSRLWHRFPFLSAK
jgi:hypothetical protein